MTQDGHVQLHLFDGDAEAALSDHPTGERLVRRAWFSRAPKRLAASLAEADSASPGEVGDLPSGIGRAATRAVAGAGITTLDG